jgi:hypothetical protein
VGVGHRCVTGAPVAAADQIGAGGGAAARVAREMAHARGVCEVLGLSGFARALRGRASSYPPFAERKRLERMCLS